VTADDWLFWLPNIPPPDTCVVLDGGEKCQEDPSSINPEAPGSANPSEVSSAMVHDDEKEGNVRHVKECDGKKMPASFVEQSVSGVVVRRARPFPNCLLLLLLDDDVVDFDVSRMLTLVMIFTVLLSARTGHLNDFYPLFGCRFSTSRIKRQKSKIGLLVPTMACTLSVTRIPMMPCTHIAGLPRQFPGWSTAATSTLCVRLPGHTT